MNNELKKEIRGYYLNNMEELITLVNDMYAYTGDSALQELLVYPMDEINYLLDNHTLLEVLESIDYDNFNPFHRWYRWDYNGNLISLDNEELEDEYESCILEILDVLFTYIDHEGLENTINDFYFNESTKMIINNSHIKIKTNKNVPSFFYNIRNFKNIFVCDFNNHDYFLLEDTIYSSCISA